MKPEELRELIALGHEQSSVEFKGPGPWTGKHLRAKTIRAMLAMSNVRDGGVVVIGVAEEKGGLKQIGVEAADAGTWLYDHVADLVSQYADPPVQFTLEKVVLDGATYVVIEVTEFLDVPVVCKKAYTVDGVVELPEGACFVRPRRKPESVQVGTSIDMRDLIDLATNKALARFARQLQAAGLLRSSDLSESGPAIGQEADNERFAQQTADLP